MFPFWPFVTLEECGASSETEGLVYSVYMYDLAFDVSV